MVNSPANYQRRLSSHVTAISAAQTAYDADCIGQAIARPSEVRLPIGTSKPTSWNAVTWIGEKRLMVSAKANMQSSRPTWTASTPYSTF